MDEKTERQYRDAGQLPSQLHAEHTWRTRPDPFEQVWPGLKQMLELDDGLEAKTLFEYLQRKDPGRFADGQLRTLQRRVKVWRALEGPATETYFAQVHELGRLCQSDFTHMTSLAITIHGRPFDHLLYHFVLTYSNWETASICFSESFEALIAGLQDALWELGGVPHGHQTDCLSAAVHKLDHPEAFTARYAALMRHYGLEGRKTNPSSPHENGCENVLAFGQPGSGKTHLLCAIGLELIYAERRVLFRRCDVLVQELLALYRAHPQCTLLWIAAHSGNRWNEYADSLATSWMRAEL